MWLKISWVTIRPSAPEQVFGFLCVHAAGEYSREIRRDSGILVRGKDGTSVRSLTRMLAFNQETQTMVRPCKFQTSVARWLVRRSLQGERNMAIGIKRLYDGKMCDGSQADDDDRRTTIFTRYERLSPFCRSPQGRPSTSPLSLQRRAYF